MTKPILFVDVDGVLNCPDANWPVTCVPVRGGPPAFVPAGTPERIAALAGGFELVWCTAWTTQECADLTPAVIGSSGNWPAVRWGRYKLPAIEAMACGRPWAWIDDEAHWELEQLGRSDVGENLLVVPDPSVGLTDAHVTQLLAFAQRVTAAAGI